MSGKGVHTREKGFTNKEAERTRRVSQKTEISNAELQESIQEERRLARIMLEFPRTLSGALDIVMQEYRINTVDLARDSDLSAKTISRMRSRNGNRPTLKTMVQLCIGLRVPPMICLALIEVAGYRLQFYGEELAYYYILTQKIRYTLYECNQYLAELGYSQLGETYIVL